MMKIIAPNTRFERLTVIETCPKPKHLKNKCIYYKCRCDCGAEYITNGIVLRSGIRKSCGCLMREKSGKRGSAQLRTHGLSKTPEHRAWLAMIYRCGSPGCPAYGNYGGRGISVCPEWHNFVRFLSDVGPRPSPAHSLDRYPNNDGNYEPGNVRWATSREQNRNTRSVQTLEFKGISLTIPEWADRIGTTPPRLRQRLYSGWSIEKALTRKFRHCKRRNVEALMQHIEMLKRKAA